MALEKSESIVVRDANVEDFKALDHYFDHASDEFLYELGFDPAEYRKSPRTDYEKIRLLTEMPIEDRPAMLLAIDVDSNPVGFVTVMFKEAGQWAEVHAHIFDAIHRGKGLAGRAFDAGLAAIFARRNVETLVCEPTATNLPINLFLQKMGLQILDSYTTPAGDIFRERIANRYEITREFLNGRLR